MSPNQNSKTRGSNSQFSLFDPPQAPKQPAQTAKSSKPQDLTQSAISVTELSSLLKNTLKKDFSKLLIRGEIADFKGVHRSGHLYFSLKDENAQIRAVMWKFAVQKVAFKLDAGVEVLATGKLDFYSGGGSLQIVIEKMEPLGVGALQLKFEELKKKLSQEGLFSAEHKKEIPTAPKHIALLTGKSTAALQDMIKVFRQRYPLVQLSLFSCSVQGTQAPQEIIQALEKSLHYHKTKKEIDLIILARGGGSYEDLFCFNDEDLVRKLFACPLPLITGIGHEIDFTLADFVADKRAATPTHAAQISVPDFQIYFERLKNQKDAFSNLIYDRIHQRTQRLDLLSTRIDKLSPQKQIAHQKNILDQLLPQFRLKMQQSMHKHQHRFKETASKINLLSPLKSFERGYSLTLDSDGKNVKSVQNLSPGTSVKIQLLDGKAKAKILEVDTESLLKKKT